MQTTRGAVVVAAGDADAPALGLLFLEAQLAHARTEASRAAAALVLACRTTTPNLEEIADATCTAVAELRMALQALALADAKRTLGVLLVLSLVCRLT